MLLVCFGFPLFFWVVHERVWKRCVAQHDKQHVRRN